MPKKTPTYIAVCSFELDATAPGRVQLFPAGTFDAPNGALQGQGPWNMSDKAAAALMARVAKRKTAIHFDYHHASLFAAERGIKAPAAGWLKPDKLEYTESGLFGLDVEWTATAAASIAEREYRYLSPVFSYDPKTGEPLDLFSIALTNTPAIDGMAELLAAASLSFNPSEPTMDIDEILSSLTYFLRLPLGSTMADVEAQLAKIKSQLGQGAETAAASSFFEAARESRASIAALQSKAPDPAQFAPVAALAAVQNELAALQGKWQAREIDGLIQPALADGRLLPAQEAWARDLGKSNFAALSQFLDTAKPIAALAGMQTGGKPPAAANDSDAALSEEEKAVCRQMGLDEKTFKAAKTTGAKQ